MKLISTFYKNIAVIVLINLFSGTTLGQEMTLYVIRPQAPINWRSPQTLFFSYAKSTLASNSYTNCHPMGHVIIELKDSSHYAIAGMEAKSKPDMAAMVYKGGYGLGIFFADIPGTLIEGQGNIIDVSERYGSGDVAYINFKLNGEAFARLWQYLEEYKSNGYDHIYNGANKPREGKGAGCSAFGTSFIEIADLLPTNELAKWMVNVPVPDKLIGGPNGNDKRIGLSKIMFSGKWADTAKHAYRTAAYYEPNLMYKWVQAAWNNPDTKFSCHKEKREAAKGIVLDCTQYPVPNEPIWINDKQAPAIAGFIQ